MAEVKKDLGSFQRFVADPKTNLYAKIPWGDGQTILREALLVADHNSYHVGQLVDAAESFRHLNATQALF